MEIWRYEGIYAMTDNKFTADGVDFLITGTTRVQDHEHGDYFTCDVKNLSNGKTATFEHQTLVKMLIKKLNLTPEEI